MDLSKLTDRAEGGWNCPLPSATDGSWPRLHAAPSIAADPAPFEALAAGFLQSPPILREA